jgi:hypothetical protein
MEDYKDMEEIYSNPVRAGKRTYFFDVRATRADDYYLTITESKRIFDDNGNPHYKKHKIFLYKEDFEKFRDAFNDTVNFIIDKKGSEVISNKDAGIEEIPKESSENDSFTDLKFEDV